MGESTLNIGDVVKDCDDTNPNRAIIVNIPSARANGWDLPRLGRTVAEDNPDYPSDALVVTVVFEETLDDTYPEWNRNRDNPLSYTTLDKVGLPRYSFPAPRLELVEEANATETTGSGEGAAEEYSPSEEATSASTNGEIKSSMPSTSNTTSPDSASEPSDAVRALKARLEDGDMTTELEADKGVIYATKLGDTYCVRPGEVIDGDGLLRNRLEEVVETHNRAKN